ncbi:hypothetical protein IG631_00265 [Alternaria alternata]|nr:hypothetical protein IG631_00265 [Alternaria alternata]
MREPNVLDGMRCQIPGTHAKTWQARMIRQNKVRATDVAFQSAVTRFPLNAHDPDCRSRLTFCWLPGYDGRDLGIAALSLSPPSPICVKLTSFQQN